MRAKIVSNRQLSLINTIKPQPLMVRKGQSGDIFHLCVGVILPNSAK